MNRFPAIKSGVARSSAGKVTPRVLRFEGGDGATQTAPDGMNNMRREWNVNFENMNMTDYDAIYEFVWAMAEQAAVIHWTAPKDKVERQWKIEGDISWKTTGVTGSISLVLKQEF